MDPMGITSAGRNMHLQPGTCCGLFAWAEGQAPRQHGRAPLFCDTLEVNHPDMEQQHFRTSSISPGKPHDANQNMQLVLRKATIQGCQSTGGPPCPLAAPALTTCHKFYDKTTTSDTKE